MEFKNGELTYNNGLQYVGYKSFFVQGDEAEEYLKRIDEEGEEEFIEYMENFIIPELEN